MKRLLLISGLLLMFSATFGQRAFVVEKQNNLLFTQNLTAVIDSTTDTLGLAAFRNKPIVLYKDQLGGYAAGTNFFGDKAKAQEFDSVKKYNISKVLFYFGAKKKVAPDSISFLNVNIYALNDTGFASGGGLKKCPGKILHTRKLLLDSIDTIAGHFTVVNFDWALTDSATNYFAIGFDMSNLDSSDQVGLYSTKDSAANKSQRSWEKNSNGFWYTMLRTWPLDIDFAIFPVVNEVVIGMKEIKNKDALLLTAAPNPCNDRVSISYTLDNASPVSLLISDAEGKLIVEQKFNILSKGKQKLEINTAALKAGVYCYTLQTNKFTQSKRLVVIH